MKAHDLQSEKAVKYQKKETYKGEKNMKKEYSCITTIRVNSDNKLIAGFKH